MPAVAAWATKVAGLSTSLMVSVPAVEISAARLVSVRLAVAAERTAASLVPRMWMVTEVSVPSAAGHRERVGVGGAGGKLVVRRARRVGPGAGGVDREGAVGAGGGGLGDEGRRAVDVADGQRAGGRNIGGQVGLGQVGRGGREDRGVVGAEDVDGDRGQRAVGRWPPRTCRCRWCRRQTRCAPSSPCRSRRRRRRSRRCRRCRRWRPGRRRSPGCRRR